MSADLWNSASILLLAVSCFVNSLAIYQLSERVRRLEMWRHTQQSAQTHGRNYTTYRPLHSFEPRKP